MIYKIILFLIFLIPNFVFAQSPNIIEQKTFYAINYQRKIHNLNELKWNEKLAKAAKNHSDWMARVGKMVHLRGKEPTSFEELKNGEHHPVNRIIKSGYYPFEKIYNVKYHSNGVSVNSFEDANDYWGEIIAHGRPGKNKFYPYNVDIAVGGWMRSPGHKAQILKPSFKEMGVSITSTPKGEVFWCVTFGKKD